jgi:hypothetical protein
MFLKNKITKSIAVLVFITSTSIHASTTPDINALECTDAELAKYTDKSTVKQPAVFVSMAEFETSHQEVKVKEIEMSPELKALFKEDCWAAMGKDMETWLKERKEKFNAAMDALKGLMQGGNPINYDALLESAWEKIKEEVEEAVCKAAKSVGEFAQEAEDSFIKAGQKEFSDRMRESGLDVLTDDSKMDAFLNKLTKEKLNDKEGLLKWKDGSIDKEHFKSKTQSSAGKKTDQKVHDEISNLFDGF